MQFRVLFILSFVFASIFLRAQNFEWKNPNFRKDSALISDTVKLLNKGILPDKFQIFDSIGNPIPKEFYTINYERNEVYFNSSLAKQMVKINYFVNPRLAESIYFTKNPNIIVEDSKPVDIFHQIEPNSKQSNKDVFDGLNSKGSMVRGIRFGNKIVEVRVAELKEFTRKEDADKMYEMISETRITEEVE